MADSESPAGIRRSPRDRSVHLVLFALAALIGGGGVLFAFARQGIWDPAELETAELARRIAHGLLGAKGLGLPDDEGLPTRGELGRGELPFTLIALGFRGFGLSPWAGRLPLALGALIGLLALHACVARLGSRRAAWLSVLVLATLPPYFLHARTMLGDAVTLAAGLVAFSGLALAVFDGRSSRVRRLALAAGVLGLVAGFWCRGLALGVSVPLLGVGIGWLAARLAGAAFDRAGAVLGGAILGSGAVAAMIGAIAIGATPRDEYSRLVGATTGGAFPIPTFDISLRDLGHALFPWTALVVVALARTTLHPGLDSSPSAESERSLGLRLSVVASAFVALVANTAVAPELGLIPYLAPGSLAMACGITFDDLDRGTPPSRWLGLFSGALTLVLALDFRSFPEKGLVAFGVAGAVFPESFAAQGFRWLAAAAALVALGCFFFLIDEGPIRHRFRCRDYSIWPLTLKRTWRGRLWFAMLVLALGLGLFELVGVLSDRYLHLASFENSGELPRVAARAGLGALVGLCVAPPSLLLARDLSRGALGLFGSSQRGTAACVVAALAGGLMSLGYYPALMRQVSPKQAFDAYLGRARPGEPLGLLGPDAKALRYQAGASARSLRNVDEALDFLLFPGRERRFLALRSSELAALNAGYRARTTPRANLPVVDASSSELILASNRPGDEPNQNPLAAFLPAARPAPAHPLDVDLGGKLRVLGWDVRDAAGVAVASVSTGVPYTFTIYYEVTERLSASWETFIHVDALQRRYNGDHPPLEGRYSPSLWLPGDFVVDRHEIRLLPNFAGGVYRVYFGLYSGDRRLEVRRGDHQENRIEGGILMVE